jgi:hypothetical protein
MISPFPYLRLVSALHMGIDLKDKALNSFFQQKIICSLCVFSNGQDEDFYLEDPCEMIYASFFVKKDLEVEKKVSVVD